MPGNYKFTTPIRYFKANDPNYYEVDNIPLRQLEENILYLKEVIEPGALTSTISSEVTNILGGAELPITQIKDLKVKPGGQMSIKVNPGKFTARINSVNKITNLLSKLTYAYSTSNTITNVTESLSGSFYSALKANILGGSVAHGFNGLETVNAFFTHKYGVHLSLGGPTTTGVPEYNLTNSNVQDSGEIGYPVITHGGFRNITSGYVLSTIAGRLQEIHRNFVQMWGGVFRTSLVSLEETETVEIDTLKPNESFYVDQNGTITNNPVNQRIDLVFVYAVPIDSAGATIADYHQSATTPGQQASVTPAPKYLTKPMIGVVRGAGVGLVAGGSTSELSIAKSDSNRSHRGRPKILLNPGDSVPESGLIGVKNSIGNLVRGSFPSPDDLLNLAPALINDAISNTYSQTDARLIGQSVMPLAYVVVRTGANSITKNDIIDIRPFLRTTELTYNERAGIAAASPPLSFANTAVGRLELKEAVDSLRLELQQVQQGLQQIGNHKIEFLTEEKIRLFLCNFAGAIVNSLDSEFSNAYGSLSQAGSPQFATFNLISLFNNNTLPNNTRGIIVDTFMITLGGPLDGTRCLYAAPGASDGVTFDNKMKKATRLAAIHGGNRDHVEDVDTNQCFVPIENRKVSFWSGYEDSNLLFVGNRPNNTLLSVALVGYYT